MSHNTALHRLVRPVARMAAGARLTPNQITTMRLATGLGAAVAFAQGTYGAMVVGGLIFVLSMVFDRVDGELARATNQMSRIGHWYDLASDCIASIATFIGLGIGVSLTEGSSALWFGALAGLGIGALFFELNVLKVASVSGHALFGGRLVVDSDDAMILVPILVWCDLAELTVIIAAVVAPLTAVVVAALGIRRRRSEPLRAESGNGDLGR